ncbi:MAG TPA: PAS domain S-box protein [Methylococcaceae bacterium]|nr:PAS domain S-box protein [Methylococcaceae bacterium]
MAVTVILVVSIVLQFVAAGLALRLMYVTGKRVAWVLIAMAVVLMAARRAISLFEYFAAGAAKQPDTYAELVALAISGLMVAGLALISPLFKDLKKMGEALGESESLYRSLVTAMAEGVVFQDAGGRITAANPRAERMLGLTAEQLAGQTSLDRAPYTVKDDGTPFPGELHPAMVALRTGQPQADVVMGIHRPDGTLAWISINSQPLFNAGALHPCAVVSTFHNISAQKRAESINLARLRLLQFASRHTLDELLEATLDEAEALTGSLVGFYHFLEADQMTLSLQEWSTRTKAKFCKAEGKGRHYDVAEAGVWVDCIHQRRAVIHNDYAALAHRKGLPDGHAEIVREMVVPVFRGDKIVALLGVGNKPGDYTPADLEAVSLLADLAWEITELKRTEMALVASEKRFHSVFENSPVSTWEKDLSAVKQLLDDLKAQGIQDIEACLRQHPETVRQCAGLVRIVDTNQASVALLEATGKEELLQRLPTTFVSEPDTVFQHELLAIWSGTTEMARDAIVQTLGGNRRHVTLYFSVIPGYERTFSKVLVSLIDISERKLAEGTLRRRETEFRALVENSPDEIIRYDRDCRRTYVNPALVRTLGIPVREMLGRTPMESSPGSAEIAAYQHKIEEVFATGRDATMELIFVAPRTGKAVSNSVRFVPEFDRYGQVASVLSVGRDISAQKETERQLRTLVENLPDLVARFDTVGRHLYVNPAAVGVSGLTIEHLVGKTHLDIDEAGTGALRQALYQAIRRTAEEGKPVAFEGSRPTLQGGRRTFDFRFYPERDQHGTVTSVLGIAHDITEQKRTEEERMAHLRFFESMDRINQTLQGSNDLQQILYEMLDAALEIFACDRAWLVYPCDPDAAAWWAPMERTRPEYPGILVLGHELPMDEEIAAVYRTARAASAPVSFGPGTEHPVPHGPGTRFQIKSMVATAGYPKGDKPYLFGLHQCAYPRVWTAEEIQLLQEIGRRLTDVLTSLLAYRSLQESELRYREVFENTSDILFGTDVTPEGRFKFAVFNPAWEKTVGLDGRAVSGRYLEEFIPPENARSVFEKYRLCMEKNAPVDYEEQLAMPSGQRYFHTTLVPVHDTDGRIYRLFGISRDITERKRAESNLDKERALLRTILDTIPDLVFFKDVDSIYLGCNKAFEEYFGAAENVIVGKTDFDFVDVETAEFFRKNDCEMLASGELHRNDEWVTYPDGRRVFLETIKTPYYSRDGKLLGLLGISRDMTERKAAEKELIHYAAIIESSDDAIIGKTLDGVITSWNKGAERIFGYTEDEALGRNIAFLISEAYLDEQRLMLEEIRQGHAIKHYETVRRRKDGQPIDVSVTVSPLLDATGRVIGASKIARDISEHKRAEEALRRSEKSLKEAQRIAHLGNWELDLVDNRLIWSDEVYRIFEIDPQRFGASYDAFLNTIHPDDRQFVDSAYSESVANRMPYDVVHRLRMSDGRVKYVNERCETFYDTSGRAVRSIGTVLDITERRKAEEELRKHREHLEDLVAERTQALEAANRELEAFSYSVSHDLRTPLRAIDGFSRLLAKKYAEALDDEAQRLIRVVRDNSSRMSQLIDDILAFSRAGRLEIRQSAVDMESLVRSVWLDLEPDRADRDVRLDLKPLPSAWGDPALLRQVWTNLLANAVKFTQHRTVGHVEVGGMVEDANSHYYVTDDGAGFDPAYVHKLFGVFQRLHGVEEFEGTGIGLAIVKRIVTRHGGSVAAEGKVGEGATFRFTLPHKES